MSRQQLDFLSCKRYMEEQPDVELATSYCYNPVVRE